VEREGSRVAWEGLVAVQEEGTKQAGEDESIAVVAVDRLDNIHLIGFEAERRLVDSPSLEAWAGRRECMEQALDA